MATILYRIKDDHFKASQLLENRKKGDPEVCFTALSKHVIVTGSNPRCLSTASGGVTATDLKVKHSANH
jgi:hypothetical protein